MKRGDLIVSEARQMLGTPFHWHARLPGIGIDCVGLVILTARRAGVEIDDFTSYTKGDQLEVITREMGKVASKVRKPVAGDVVILQFGINRYHFGIFADGNVIHACSTPTLSKVVEQPITDEFTIQSIWRFK